MRYMEHFSFLLFVCTYQVVAITAFPVHAPGCENWSFYNPVYIPFTGDRLTKLLSDLQAQLQFPMAILQRNSVGEEQIAGECYWKTQSPSRK